MSTPLSIQPPKYKEPQSIPFLIKIDFGREINSHSKKGSWASFFRSFSDSGVQTFCPEQYAVMPHFSV